MIKNISADLSAIRGESEYIMNEKTRMQKLLYRLNQILDSYLYYDDESGELFIDLSEDECYNLIMLDDEMHLLTSETVKEIIHLCYTDWFKFDAMCREYKAY